MRHVAWWRTRGVKGVARGRAGRSVTAMKRGVIGMVWGVIGVTGGFAGAALAADENFSKAIPAAEFSAAGLGKLSPAELARLDGLVRDFKNRPEGAARREAVVAAPRVAVVEAVPPRVAPAKVKLAPGTQVEFSTVESRIVGEFRGWEGRTLFTLENGQRWQVAGGDIYASPVIMNPAVKIAPGMLGSFWMTVEGVRARVKVTPVGSGK